MVRGRVSRRKEIILEGIFRCLQCGFTRQETYRESMAREVPAIVSDGETSSRTEVELYPGEVVRVGDRLEARGSTVEVTGIEVGGSRVEDAPAEIIETLWSKVVDRVRVKVSLNKGGRTKTYSLDVAPDEEFEVGTILELGKERGVIHRLKTERGILRDGTATAEEIRRVYCKAVRRHRSGPRRGRGGR